eukprot:SAG31_NODE_18106_length_646_cov_1.851920_1_plen_24_part_01
MVHADGARDRGARDRRRRTKFSTS